MDTPSYDARSLPPPDFHQARTRHQKARSAGMNPNYWYPVEHDSALRIGQVQEVVFWKRSIALFRGSDGVARAIDNRCAHRQLKLTAGKVDGCNLACLYHGWRHDGDGQVVEVPHDLFGRQLPKSKTAGYPVQVRYGLIWIFPGDPDLASSRSIPSIPELEGHDRWSCVRVDASWHAHYSMIIDNVSDFTHAYLHRKYQPFTYAELTNLETGDEKVGVSYRTKVGGSRMAALFMDRAADTSSIDLCYEYPYQWSNTGQHIKHWCFVLPINEQETRCFFLFMFAPRLFKVPIVPLRIRGLALRGFLRMLKSLYMVPLLDQDRIAVEAEQDAHNQHHAAPIPELNPAVHEFQRLTIEKWQEYLDSLGRVDASIPKPRLKGAPAHTNGQ
jgi:phenylpropionate dioxygenase-like ring-hydroxylating dioxygenase large terminal subunit